MVFRIFKGKKEDWGYQETSILGLSPSSDFIKYLYPLIDSNLNITFKYDKEEKKDPNDDEKYILEFF